MTGISRLVRVFSLCLALCLVMGSLSGCMDLLGIEKNPNTGANNAPGMLVEGEIDRFTESTEATASSDAADSSEPTEVTVSEETVLEGTVTGDQLNVREGPGTKYDSVGMLKEGTKVVIFEQQLVEDVPWGRTEKGWLSLRYVRLDDPTQLLTLKEEPRMGITMESLSVRTGPGKQYPDSSPLGKNIRVEILETCCGWGRIANGWVDLAQVYIDGTPGPEKPIMGTVTGSGVNVRSGPGTQHSVNTTVGKGDRLKVFYQVDMGSTKWGCTPKGWISMDYVLLDGQQAPIDPAILGTWQDVIVADDRASLWRYSTWEFKSDGTFTVYYSEAHFFYTPETGPVYDNSLASGSQGYMGNFSFDGKTLTLNYTFVEWEDNFKPYTESYPASVEGNRLFLLSENSPSGHLYKGSLEEVADRLMKG